MPRTIPIWQLVDAFDPDDEEPVLPELGEDNLGEEDEYIEEFGLSVQHSW